MDLTFPVVSSPAETYGRNSPSLPPGAGGGTRQGPGQAQRGGNQQRYRDDSDQEALNFGTPNQSYSRTDYFGQNNSNSNNNNR